MRTKRGRADRKKRRRDRTDKQKNEPVEDAEILEEGEDLIDIYTLTDEDGNVSDFELIGQIELDGKTYYGLVPLEGESDEYVLLRGTAGENGEEMLETIDDDEEFERAADAFEDRFMSDLDLDEN
ncbi:MAG: DUF1292 domain-containing protein [Clostridia bacterium]|nr:DUF1292 domain-containing protein [Clostridia bacterium]